MKRFETILLLTAVTVLLAACSKNPAGGDEPTPPGPEPVVPTSVTISLSELSLSEGETFTLEVTVLPENAEYDSVIWSSSNTDCATVADGVVTAVAEGTAVITAKAGEVSSSATVTVTGYTLPDNAIIFYTQDYDTSTFHNDEEYTKSVINGMSPVWKVGDKIKFYGFNSEFEPKEPVVVTLTNEKGNGMLMDNGRCFAFIAPEEWNIVVDDFVYAVYPADLALGARHGYDIDGRVFFNIPAVQDGTFSSANMCATRCLAGYKTGNFDNLTSVIRVRVPEQVKKIVVTTSGMKFNGPVWVGNLGGTLSMDYCPEYGQNTCVTEVEVSSEDVYFSLAPRANILPIGSKFEFLAADNTVLKTLVTTESNSLNINKITNIGTITLD